MLRYSETHLCEFGIVFKSLFGKQQRGPRRLPGYRARTEKDLTTDRLEKQTRRWCPSLICPLEVGRGQRRPLLACYSTFPAKCEATAKYHPKLQNEAKFHYTVSQVVSC